MSSKVSVIVSCYNVEKYIEKCLMSIINQTYKNIEIIAVDDASTDTTLERIHKFEQLDSRFKVIAKQKNEGLLHTRKTGVSISTGTLLTFVDGDDYLDATCINTLIESKTQTDAQVIFGTTGVLKNGNLSKIKKPQGLLSGNYYLSKLIKNGQGGVINALYCKNLFDKIMWGESDENRISIGEDKFLLLQLLPSIKVFSMNGKITYYYLRHEESMTAQHRKEFNSRAEINLINFLEKLLDNDPKVNKRLVASYLLSKITDYLYVTNDYKSGTFIILKKYFKFVPLSPCLGTVQKIYIAACLLKSEKATSIARRFRNALNSF